MSHLGANPSLSRFSIVELHPPKRTHVTPAEEHRLTELCELLDREKNREAFMVLVGELNKLLEIPAIPAA